MLILIVGGSYRFSYFIVGHIDGRFAINFEYKIAGSELSALVGGAILLK